MNLISTPMAVRGGELVLVVALALVVSATALAGTDATFSTTTSRITGWSGGSLGKLAGAAAVASALVGMVLKFDWRLIGGALGIGLTAATGPGIVTGLMTGVF